MPKATSDFLNLSGLKKRGWTGRLVDHLIRQPDLVEPISSTGRTRKLWDKERVEEAEKAPQFLQHRMLSNFRAQTKMAEDRKEEAHYYLRSVQIDTPRLSLDEVYRRGLDLFEKRNGGKGSAKSQCNQPGFRDEVSVLYLAEALVPVIEQINAIAGEANGRELRIKATLEFYDRIKKVYPTLLQECCRQQSEYLSENCF